RVGGLDRLLRPLGDVRAGEGATVLLLLANVFLLMAGYYICKTVREPLILVGGGAEVKSYAAAGMAVVLMGFIPLYSWFASRLDRMRLITVMFLFFTVNLELFWLWAKAGIPYLGVAFFIWVGIFNNAVVAQFWSYGNDLYRLQTGQRLFPIIGVGATLGSPVGAWLTKSLFKAGVSAHSMFHITAVILLVCLGFFWLVEKREGAKRQRTEGAKLEAGPGGFALLARSPYLRLIALLIAVLNLVNTTGEYILDLALLAEVATRAATTPTFDELSFIGAFKGDYFFWVNVAAVLIQALLVSRIVKYLGIAGAVLALPLVALGAYGAIVSGVSFAAIRWAKTAENSADYSVMNTARQMLWLPTSRDEKYKAKQAVDTFVVRAADVLSAGLVYLGTTVLALNMQGFARANLVLVVLWIAVAFLVIREYRALGARKAAEG
ncbi:MAG TPA: Npt1/Npt2 family nucleotide transporter, partial [Vicinamibacteria bacterium]